MKVGILGRNPLESKIPILPIVTACIVIICVVSYYKVGILGSSPRLSALEHKNAALSSRGTDAAIKSVIAPGDTGAKGATRDNFIYPIDSTRDPFQQMPTTPDTGEPIVGGLSIMLTGIIWDESNPAAIIVDSNNNSYVVRAGEEIHKAKILDIQPNSIVIEKDGKRQELILWSAKL